MTDPVPAEYQFEQRYPLIHRFIQEQGCIEMGYTDMTESFVRAYDEGGTVYEGRADYIHMDAAFADLEAGIKAYNDKWGIFND